VIMEPHQYGVVREFVRTKLRKGEKVTVKDIAAVAPPKFSHPNMAFALILLIVAEIAEEEGIQYLEIPEHNVWVRPLKPDEFDRGNPTHFPLNVIAKIVEDSLS